MAEGLSPEEARLAQLLEESDAVPSALRDALLRHLKRPADLHDVSDASGAHNASDASDAGVASDAEASRSKSSMSDRDRPRSHKLLSRLRTQRPTALLGEMRQQLNERIGSYSAEQLDQLKAELLRLIERLDLQGEAQRLLSRVAIDVTLTIKLAPEEDAPLGVKPQVKASAKLRLTPEDDT